jgi:hypothetical protein
MMVKDAKYIDDMANGNTSSIELQVVVFMAIKEKEEIPSKVAQVEASYLNDDEMVLVIRRFKQALKWRKNNDNKPRGKCAFFKCRKIGHFIANYLDNDSDDQEKEKKGKVEKKYYKKKKGVAHIGKEWDLDCSSFDSNDEGVTRIAFNKTSLFPKVNHTCLMAKEKRYFLEIHPSIFPLAMKNLVVMRKILACSLRASISLKLTKN